MHRDCFQCDLKQVNKISQLLSLDKKVEDQLYQDVQAYLDTCDMQKTNPEIMAELWQIMAKRTNQENPYKELKSYYNQYLLSLLPQIKNWIQGDLLTALKVTIAANLIDFSAKDKLTEEEIIQMLFKAKDLNVAVDDSHELLKQLEKSQTLLYLGDNCGEIVLDKLFLSMLKQRYPQLTIYYGVRGQAIVNDVTMEDAMQVNMRTVAKVISNGDGSLGTVLSRCDLYFQQLFKEVDVVIGKGQGNFEGLVSSDKENLYFLFMVKCPIVSGMTHTNIEDIICMKNIRRERYK